MSYCTRPTKAFINANEQDRNEVLKKDSPLKKEFKNGFDDSKELIEFIGKNYLDNEILFNTALANELSFLRATLLGYKLELLPKKRDGRISIYGRSVILQLNTFIKISSNLYKDKDSKFLFVWDKNYGEINKDIVIRPEQDYYVFNLYHQNFDTLDELKTLDNKEASIIVLSSIINLKYSFKYEVYVSKDIRLEPVLEANDFRQSSFTTNDITIIEQIKKEGN